MPARLHYGIQNLLSITSTSAAVGYPALNIRETPVDRPWRSTTNALQNIDIDLGASVPTTAWLQCCFPGRFSGGSSPPQKDRERVRQRRLPVPRESVVALQTRRRAEFSPPRRAANS